MSQTADVLAHALSLGFDRAAAVRLGAPRYAREFADWLAAGHHGEMSYLAARAALRLDPGLFAPGAQSVIVVIANYYRPTGGPFVPAAKALGRVAHYARTRDYHEVIKERLFQLDAFLRVSSGRRTPAKVFVDSAPVLERDFAERAGLGFIGRNTCLITPGLGSWTFLAGLMVAETLAPGALEDTRAAEGSAKAHPGDAKLGLRAPRRAAAGCGRCTRCLDACPTQAFVAPHVLDARRCISYLTIESRGSVPGHLRPLMGNWVFGCDVCQEVCPYNRAASEGTWPEPGDETGVAAHPLDELLVVDEDGFRRRFRKTPVLRAKRSGLVRNACIAAGNSGDRSLVPLLAGLLSDPEVGVRGHAAWALGRIGGVPGRRALAAARAIERNPWVIGELSAGLVGA